MNIVKRKLPQLDVFSGIAILCVVLIHSNGYYLSRGLGLTNYIDASFQVRLLDNFVHGSVPMFIFIAGFKYALNNLEDNYKEYAVKKLKSVLKPFLILSAIFIFMDLVVYPEKYANLNLTIIKFIKIFKGENIAYQLWYIPMYICISLSYPIIYEMFKSDKVRIIAILSIVLGQRYLGSIDNTYARNPYAFVYYYIFFEMGVIICKHNIMDKIKKWDILIMLLYVSIVFIITSNPVPHLYKTLQNFLLWPVCVIAYYLLSLRFVNSNILKLLGKYSFYIFLLHDPIICKLISLRFKVSGNYDSMIYVFLVAVLTILTTVGVYKMIEKTFIKKTLL